MARFGRGDFVPPNQLERSMVRRAISCVGITALLCAAAPASAPPAASASATQPFSQRGASTTAASAKPDTRNAPQDHHHRSRHVARGTGETIGELRSQASETVSLLDQMDQSLRADIAQLRTQTADALVRLDTQARQAGLLGKRADVLEQRIAAEVRERQQDGMQVQHRLSEQDARIEAQDVRIAEASAVRDDRPLILTACAAVLGLLLAIAALFLGIRQRYAAMVEAEGHADRLFRTYRLEFDMLAQAARELEMRLQGTPLPDGAGSGAVPLRGERAATG
jgi:hypothetical protein